jgi:hypothetical protein
MKLATSILEEATSILEERVNCSSAYTCHIILLGFLDVKFHTMSKHPLVRVVDERESNDASESNRVACTRFKNGELRRYLMEWEDDDQMTAPLPTHSSADRFQCGSTEYATAVAYNVQHLRDSASVALHFEETNVQANSTTLQRRPTIRLTEIEFHRNVSDLLLSSEPL